LPGSDQKDTQQALNAEITSTNVLNIVKLRLAQQYAPRGWRPWINAVAQHLQAGQPLEKAIEIRTPAAPWELRQLFVSALQVPDPMKLVLNALQARMTMRTTWNEFLSLLVYPLSSLTFAICVAIVFNTMVGQMIDTKYIQNFGLTGFEGVTAAVKDQSQATVGIGFIVGWTLVTLVTIAVVGPNWALTSVVSGVFIFGRPLRWIFLSEMLNRFQLFIGQGASPVDAAVWVSQSFSSSGQRFTASAIASRIMRGMTLGNAIAQSALSDHLCRPALRMLDFRGPDIQQALNETAQLMQHLADQRCRSLSAIMPMLVVFVVGTIIWGMISSYMLSIIPLIRMITSLA
jgi:type II secretory pathway component PulF